MSCPLAGSPVSTGRGITVTSSLLNFTSNRSTLTVGVNFDFVASGRSRVGTVASVSVSRVTSRVVSIKAH